MAKYYVTHACGHQTEMDITGTNAHGERDKKVAYYETTLCPECYARQQAAKTGAVEEVTMSYAQYKKDYSTYKTMPNSYDKTTKTIVVFIPAENNANETNETLESEVLEISNEISAFNLLPAEEKAIETQQNIMAKLNLLKTKYNKSEHEIATILGNFLKK